MGHQQGSTPVEAEVALPQPADGGDGLRRIHEGALQWAITTPDAPALTEGTRTWSYAALAASVERAAAFLRGIGVRAGDRVMLVGENGAALAAFILAASRLDACAVLENARRAPLEVDRICSHCDPRRVVYLVGNSPDARAHALRAEASLSRLDDLGEVACGPLNDAAATDPVSGTERDLAVLIYTTGTTGEPKGVMLMHANLLFLGRMMVQLRRLHPADRVYGALPITHVMGLAAVFGGTFRAGAQLFIVPRFNVVDCAAALATHGITIMQGAPAMFAKLAEHARSHPVDAPRLRFIAAGGAPIDATVKADTEALFPGLTLHNGYGLTEGSGLCWTRLDDPRADDSVGRALPGVELKLLDAQGQPVPAGGVGELWARGPQVMKGYYRNPALTARVLRDGGWFNTEDLARIDADGNVFIVGRTKDLIISGGFNVYPLEVENALNAHPAVVHSAVVARAGASSEDVIAFVELVAAQRPALAELQAFLGERISPYKRPREIYAMAALPCSPNGKVLKNRLKQMLAQSDMPDATRLA
jgi:acyl-CoA synthetase (AMP-forming)/AMP-acid ligase II